MQNVCRGGNDKLLISVLSELLSDLKISRIAHLKSQRNTWLWLLGRQVTAWIVYIVNYRYKWYLSGMCGDY
jgi:hypothetical protein